VVGGFVVFGGGVVGVLAGWRCVSRCMGVGVYVAGEWVQVLMEKRWYLPTSCGCGPNNDNKR
jgi:hypothetical protein